VKRVVSLALVTVAVLAITPKAGAPQVRAQEDRVSLGVVAIEAKVGGDVVNGSGTVIDAERGLVLTTARAVWGATSLKLATGMGIVYGRIVARAPCDHLALIETQPRIPGLISLADRAGTPPPTGTLVVTHGRRVARGDAGLLALPSRVAGMPLRLDAPLVPEAGGGPVLDGDGRLVGLAATTDTAIPWPAIQRRLDELTPGPRRVFAGWRGQYGCSARLNRLTQAEHPRFKPADARLVIPVPASRVPGAEVEG